MKHDRKYISSRAIRAAITKKLCWRFWDKASLSLDHSHESRTWESLVVKRKESQTLNKNHSRYLDRFLLTLWLRNVCSCLECSSSSYFLHKQTQHIKQQSQEPLNTYTQFILKSFFFGHAVWCFHFLRPQRCLRFIFETWRRDVNKVLKRQAFTEFISKRREFTAV